MRGQRKNPRKAVQPFENKKRKIDIFKNYEANGVEKIQRKLEIFSTLISKKSSLDAYQEEIKALIDFTNAEFAKMLPRTATWCKTPKVKPNPRASTNPAPGCLSFQNNILYFNGQPVGKGVFYDVLPSEGNEVTISGSDERILKSH